MPVIKLAPGITTLLAPPFDLRRLAENQVTEWAVAKPVDLSPSHGVDITLARLEEMAAAYDPLRVEAAAVNFDHTFAGPAHAWIQSIEVRDGLLWVRPIEISDELREGIKEGRYRRASMEFTTDHPETSSWYLNGLAILGSARPAIKGLPPIRLSAPRYVLRLHDAGPQFPAVGQAGLTSPHLAGGGGTAAGGATGRVVAPPALRVEPGSPLALAEAKLAAVASSLEALPGEDAAVRELRLELLREQLALARVQREVAAERGSAGATTSLPPALAAARAGGDHRTWEARATHVRMGVSDVRYLELMALHPRSSAIPIPGVTPWWSDQRALDEERARQLDLVDDRSAEERAVHQRNGLTDEKALELRAGSRKRERDSQLQLRERGEGSAPR